MARLAASALSAFIFHVFTSFQPVYGDSLINVAIPGLGTVQGTRGIVRNVTLDVFKGIPYAEPPVGELRFNSPKAAVWSGFRNATQFGSACPQREMITLLLAGKEDCLYLNIYRPVNGVGALPVMVWIHGGGFINGAANYYDGTYLSVTQNVIVVTINYRLGVLGFFNIPGTNVKGNFGMLDQILALQWVKNHIGRFNGDPKKVTIFGESAGAGSVSLLTMSPLIKDQGLFIRAISESGVATAHWAVRKANAKAANDFGKMLQCNDDKELVKCLKSKSIKSILLKQDLIATVEGSPLTAPTVDGEFLKELPSELAGNNFPRSNVEIIVGLNENEGTMFAGNPLIANKTTFEQMIKTHAHQRFSKENKVLHEAMVYEYTKYDNDPHQPKFNYIPLTRTAATTQPTKKAYKWFESTADFLADWYFVRETINFAGSWAKRGNTVYMYRFSHLPKSEALVNPALKVAHALEVGYVFGAPLVGAPNFLQINYTEADRNLSLMMMDMWGSFAKSGKPGNNWPKYTASKEEYLHIGEKLKVEQKPWPRKMAFWNEFVPQIVQGASNCGKNDIKSSSPIIRELWPLLLVALALQKLII